jgi:uncharacterized membrane protein
VAFEFMHDRQPCQYFSGTGFPHMASMGTLLSDVIFVVSSGTPSLLLSGLWLAVLAKGVIRARDKLALAG